MLCCGQQKPSRCSCDFAQGRGARVSFCDTLGIVKPHEDQTLIVGTQALVDPLDDEIDSPRKNDLCPSSASTYNLTKVPLPSNQTTHPLVDPCENQGKYTLVCELPTTSEGVQNN